MKPNEMPEHPFSYEIKPAPGQEGVKRVTTDPVVDYLDALKFDPDMLDEQASRVTIPDVKRYSEQGFDLFLLDHTAKLFERALEVEAEAYKLEDVLTDSKQYHGLCDYLRYLSGLKNATGASATALLEAVESGRLLPAQVAGEIVAMIQNKAGLLKD